MIINNSIDGAINETEVDHFAGLDILTYRVFFFPRLSPLKHLRAFVLSRNEPSEAS